MSVNPDTYPELKRLFAEAMDLPAAQQLAWLAGNVPDLHMRAELARLLELDTQTNALDEQPGKPIDMHPARPTSIAGYEVSDVLGEGGTGIVYAVEEQHPKRSLALKVLRPGAFPDRGAARFEREASLLGRLDHPGIARILRAGVTELAWGRVPFLVMERVDGGQITDYVSDRQLTQKERLDLWLQIAEAVAHAHAKGVIHRDLKPANVLVNHEGQVKVVDFGIGRLLDEAENNQTLTSDGQLVGTLAYMSPEQLAGDTTAVDASTDVYALGILGYQLLTDRTPYDFADGSLAEIRRVVGGTAPALASTHNPNLRGDLDTILGKALRKDQDERYATAAAMAEDIQRHLRHEPILARQASVGLRLRKFARRNPWLVAGLASTMLALLGGLGATLHQARLARDEARSARIARTLESEARQRAESERDSALAMRDFLRFDLLQAARPSNLPGQGRDASMLDVLHQASKALRLRGTGNLAEFPAVRSSLHSTLGETFAALGQFEAADAELRIARDLAEQAGDLEQVLESAACTITLELTRENYTGAEQLALAALERAQASSADSAKVRARLLGQRAHAVQNLDRPEEAIRLLREALSEQERVLGPLHTTTLSTLHNLSSALYSMGSFPEALDLLHDVVEKRTTALGPGHSDTLSSRTNLAVIEANAGNIEGSLKQLEELLLQYVDLYGDAHILVLRTRAQIAANLTRMGEQERAREILEDVVSKSTDLLGPAAPFTIQSRGRLAWNYHRQRQTEQALAIYKELVPLAQDTLGPDSVDAVDLRAGRGDALLQAGRTDEAIQDLVFVYEARQASLNPEAPDLSTARYTLAKAYVAMDQPDLAAPLFHATWNRDKQDYGEHHPYTHMSLLGYAQTLIKLQRTAEARLLLQTLCEHANPDHPQDKETLRRAKQFLLEIED